MLELFNLLWKLFLTFWLQCFTVRKDFERHAKRSHGPQGKFQVGIPNSDDLQDIDGPSLNV